jgi:hypothetical protein
VRSAGPTSTSRRQAARSPSGDQLHWDANVLGRLWRIIEGARAAWEWWGLLAVAGVLPSVGVVLGVFEGQPWSVLVLYVVAASAFWIVIAVEGKAFIGERKRQRIARLMALRAEGVQILNRPVPSGIAVLAHKTDIDTWDEQVIGTLKEVSARESDIGWFTTLGTFQPHFHSTGNTIYDQWQNMLAEKLDRLLMIAQRLEGSKA